MPAGQTSGYSKIVGYVTRQVRDFAYSDTSDHQQSFLSIAGSLNKVVSPNDRLFSAYQGQGNAEDYFTSGLLQLDNIDALLQKHAQKKLTDCQTIADYACHYGRLLRCLWAALPNATLYACDINQAAVDFCVKEFRCSPCLVDWKTASDATL